MVLLPIDELTTSIINQIVLATLSISVSSPAERAVCEWPSAERVHTRGQNGQTRPYEGLSRLTGNFIINKMYFTFETTENGHRKRERSIWL